MYTYFSHSPDENDSKLRGGSESDDTASTISTVVDNFSLSSSTDLTTLSPSAASAMHILSTTDAMMMPSAMPATNTANVSSTSADLAKVLNSFAMLEKEFNVPAIAAAAAAANVQSKLGECLTTRLQPPASFQDNSGGVTNAGYENVTIKMTTSTTPNSPSSAADYENVIVTSVASQPSKIPPTPLPRTTTATTTSTSTTSSIEVKSPPSLIPIPRTKYQVTTPKTTPSTTAENSELPRLIHFLPKIVSTTPALKANVQQQSSITINNTVVPVSPIGKCIRLPDNGDGTTAADSYADSSSDEDEEKSYDPHAQRVVLGGVGETIVTATTSANPTAGDSTSDTATTSDEEESDDGHEDGEKLGPPSIVNGPGPTEVYFNFPWSTNMLPTIGEVEEEFSSLEQTTTAAEAKR